MSQFTFIADPITSGALRDYIMTHKIDAGDSLVLSAQDFQHLADDIKASGEPIQDVPFKILNVRIVKDPGNEVPSGKVQIVKNERL